MTMYSYSVYDRVGTDGVGVYLSHGDLVAVGDERYVRMQHGGTMLPADETWTACRHEAKRKAAAQVQDLADRLAAQAQRLRDQADSEQAMEAAA